MFKLKYIYIFSYKCKYIIYISYISYYSLIRVCLKCVYLRNSTPPVLMIAALATAENAASKSMTALRMLLQYKVIIYSVCVCMRCARKTVEQYASRQTPSPLYRRASSSWRESVHIIAFHRVVWEGALCRSDTFL